jgi:hypothetical protein
MPSNTATLLSALFSKTVELSFVSVFVALLGQVLSRRAFTKKTRYGRGQGISISDMSMRLWIMQPGSLITHWETVRYAGWTALGAITLHATLSATFYTTAAEALVAPKLTFGASKSQVLGGPVHAYFSNSTYLMDQCKSPVTTDPEFRGSTCRQIDHAGKSFRDFSTWLDDWQDLSQQSNASLITSFDERPVPNSILFENNTVVGQWITRDMENVTISSARHKRFVHNVTLAMPHANTFNAVRDPANLIPQPQDFQGQGEYEINASVPVPVLNVLCAGVSTREIEPLIFDNNATQSRHQIPSTPIDYLFGFGKKEDQLKAAQFARIPDPWNTVYNGSSTYGPEAVYILGTPPTSVANDSHMICSIKALIYSNCATTYYASGNGGDMRVRCDEHLQDLQAYSKSNAETAIFTHNPDWKDIGVAWLQATAMTQGVYNSNASIARLVTQFIPAYDPDIPVMLNPHLPSVAESLAVLGANTLVKGSFYAPFVPFWNYTNSFYDNPQTQYFNATVRYKDYASGPTQKWQGIFFVVLTTVFLLNIYALVFLIKKVFWDGQVTDYTEPENLFAIANLSPPSTSLHGACGAGPTGSMLKKKWKVDMKDSSERHGVDGHVETEYDPHNPYTRETQAQHPHFYVKCVDDELEPPECAVAEEAELRFRKNADRDKRRSRPRSVQDWYRLDDVESPAVEQYRRLAI